MKIQWQLIFVNRKRPRESQMERRGNTKAEIPRRTRKLEKRRRGGEKMSGIERGERGN